VVRALFERCPYLVLFWSRGPLLSNRITAVRNCIERTLYVYLEHPASHGYRSNASSSLRPIVAATAASATAAVSHPGAT